MKNRKHPLIDCGKQFYERRWMWGTAGNLSLRLKSDPLEFVITPSGVNKGHLTTKDLITIKDTPHPNPLPSGEGKALPSPFRETGRTIIPIARPVPVRYGKVTAGRMRVPSAETAIHQAVYRAVSGAGAVFHVHPVYSTLMSSFYGHPREKRMLKVDWFEMMKGIGVGEEESAEVAILPNWQDVSLIARDVTDYLKTSPKALPVVLIYNHGLTGWGATPDQARNHLEIMEYVCQYLYLKEIRPRH
jgi:methylthioribose-1-phosphate isomerase